MSDDWQSPKFRQGVIGKIQELLSNNLPDPSKNASVMENQLFRRARNRDEYLTLIAKLFMHYKDLSQRRPQQTPPQQNAEMGQQNMMQDPLNALHNLANQGNRNPQMMSMPGGPNANQMTGPGGAVPASNLLQTLNQQRPGQQMQGIRGPVPMGPTGTGVSSQQMVPPMSGTSGPSGPSAGGPGPGGNDSSGNGVGIQMMGSNTTPSQQGQIGVHAQQLSGMQNQTNNGAGTGSSNASSTSSSGGGSSSNVGVSGSPAQNQIQLNTNQMQGAPMNVNSMNVQQMPPQMQQMQQNQMPMGMNHPPMNTIMNTRPNQGNAVNVGPNTGPPQGMQNMQSIPPNLQQQQQQGGGSGPGGPMPQHIVGSPAQQQVGNVGMSPNVVQQGNLNPMINMSPNMQQKGNIPMSPAGQMFRGGIAVGGQQQQQPFMRSSPSPADAQIQQQQQQQQQLQHIQQQQQHQQQQQQMVNNQQQPQQVPTSQQQSQPPQMPTPQMIPSPALVPVSSPQMANLMQQNTRQQNIRPQQSPSASLNTPGQVATNSPFNPQEEQLYREKYKYLTKYIEPLKRMVTKISNDGANTEKITKMSKLLEILCNPAQRVSLETLLKCEKALEKLDLASYSGQQFGKSSNPLLEVINTTLQNPIANHTLHRTFRPSLDLLFGTDICAPIPVKKARVEEKPSGEQEIPHVLQGEIARLDQKFKIKLDTTCQKNNKSIYLTCCLDDKYLPNVPPVNVSIPEDYPWVAPDCILTDVDYSTTPFLKTVQAALTAHIANLPKSYSLSQLLDTWEMSVRQACSPHAKPIREFKTIFGM